MSAVTQTRVIRSEWTKLRSVRSSWLSLGIGLGLIAVLAVVVPAATVSNWTAADEAGRATFNAVERSLTGIYLAQLAFGVLGVLVITGEYSTGMIRATFAAVPRRLPVLWGKLLVMLGVTFVLSAVVCVAAFLIAQPILSGENLDISLGDAGVARAVLGSAAYLTATALLGVALGFVSRSAPAGIATVVGLQFVLPPIVDTLPSSVSDAIFPYLLSIAGSSVLQLHKGPDTLAPMTALAVAFAYPFVVVAIAAVTLIRRDV